MTIRVIQRHGKRRLLIDITFTQRSGTKSRFRRLSTAAGVAAARDEERLIRDRIARTGSPNEPAVVPQQTFQQVVRAYQQEFMPANLKPSTQRGYNSVINTHLLPSMSDNSIVDVSSRCAQELDIGARAPTRTQDRVESLDDTQQRADRLAVDPPLRGSARLRGGSIARVADAETHGATRRPHPHGPRGGVFAGDCRHESTAVLPADGLRRSPT